MRSLMDRSLALLNFPLVFHTSRNVYTKFNFNFVKLLLFVYNEYLISESVKINGEDIYMFLSMKYRTIYHWRETFLRNPNEI